MYFALISKYLNIAVAIVLVVRLVSLRLFSPYRIFAVFLLYKLSLSAFYIGGNWQHLFGRYKFDYRIIWLIERPVGWVLYVWVAYALLHRIMMEHYGIFRVSRKILIGCFIAALVLATGIAEMELALSSHPPKTVLGSFVNRFLIIESACLITSLVLLAAMLVFLLWFPVQVARNVALLCAGFLVYYAADTAVLFLRLVLPSEYWQTIDFALYWIEILCLLTWLVFLNRRGEQRKIRPGHSWKRKDQEQMIGQLNAINAALLRSARR